MQFDHELVSQTWSVYFPRNTLPISMHSLSPYFFFPPLHLHNDVVWAIVVYIYYYAVVKSLLCTALYWSLKLSPDWCIMHSLRSLFSASKLTFSKPFPYFTSHTAADFYNIIIIVIHMQCYRLPQHGSILLYVRTLYVAAYAHARKWV